ncbi:INO80 complex subunit D-B [Eumeta japonica]|uniref:INO80 complex subunit D-B n=1 Tax=Eumeta variegata TaxID=151549 RepID=A0A4C1SQ69_EUMVA|nr:INO80 complex subunit D-B [Eumeta japonica]
MAVEGVPACGGEGNAFIHDSSGDEQVYMSHISDNFFHTKYKIDPNDLYTFHDSDVIAGEITVSHTDDSPLNFVDPNEVKTETCPQPEIDIIGKLVNGEVKQDVKDNIVPNGHYPLDFQSNEIKEKLNVLDSKLQDEGKIQNCNNEQSAKATFVSDSEIDVQNFKGHSVINQDLAAIPVTNTNNSISSVNVNNANQKLVSKTASETFLDVYKREQIGFVESNQVIKPETTITTSKPLTATPRKNALGKISTPTKGKRGRGPAVHEALQRIPTQRRAQVVQNQVWHAPGNELFDCGPLTEHPPHPFTRLDSSSDDDEQMPNFSSWMSSGEEGHVEARGTRLANRRAALRRQVAQAAAALKLLPSNRKHRALAHLIRRQSSASGRIPTRSVVRLLAARGMPALLSAHDRRQLREAGWSGGESGNYYLERRMLSGSSSSTLTTCIINKLAQKHRLFFFKTSGMNSRAETQRRDNLRVLSDPSDFSSQVSRRSGLRSSSFPVSQINSFITIVLTRTDRHFLFYFTRPRVSEVFPMRLQASLSDVCPHILPTPCEEAPLPCTRYCLAHVTHAPEQRLYVACAAVFAGGSRCKQPLLPLHDQTPLCTEHAWKRDNYDKISRECKPKKVVRKRVFPATPRRAKRRGRPPPRRPPPAAPDAAPHTQALSEVHASNSSAYESSEEATAGALSENEFIVSAAAELAEGADRLEVSVVEQVPHDDILDPAVLNQIPDEAFTEFFNQTEGTPAFAESEELERALEAVLDGRALDSLTDCVFQHQPRNKVQVPPAVGVEMSTGAPS